MLPLGTYIGSKRVRDIAVREVVGTDPAAGVEVGETLGADVAWEVLALWLELVTSATAANRYVEAAMDDAGANEFVRIPQEATFNQAASLTRKYSYSKQARAVNNAANSGSYGEPWPDGVIVKPGSRIRSITTNLQVGDNYVAPRLLVVEYGMGS
jgi:hypothetical protein